MRYAYDKNSDWFCPSNLPVDERVVQLLCQVTPESHPEPTAPRSCDCAVSSGDHAEGDYYVSIGFYSEMDDEWEIAGWDMTQDCWTSANCVRVVGWFPLGCLPDEVPS